MKYLVILFFFLSFFAQAQDTLIFRKKSKKVVVNILYTTDDEVVYKKKKDKVDRSFIVSKSQLQAIAFRDSTMQNFQDPNEVKDLLVLDSSAIDTAYLNRFMTLTPEQRKKLYEYGVLDAEDFYTIGDFFTSRKRITGAAPLPYGGFIYSKENEKPFEYPNKILFKYADYRKGYQDKAWKLNWKYRGQVAAFSIGILGLAFALIKFT